ncbi:MAG TPA: hypothetical protein VL856_05855 [Acidimicrobiia bacterium]|nr:hypothetical protein [Acidimicrobiia bacterium]
MIRKLSLLVPLVLAATGLAAAPAGAGTSVPPPMGTVSCAITGQATMSPPLPSAANEDGSLKPIKFKLKGDLSACDSSGVTGGKAPITSGKIQMSGKIDEGASCSDLTFGPPDFTFNPNKLQLKWYGTTADGRKTKVASDKSDIFFGDIIPKGWEYTSDTFDFSSHDDIGPFADETAVIDVILDNLGDAGACALGGNDLGIVKFSAGGGSRISVSP